MIGSPVVAPDLPGVTAAKKKPRHLGEVRGLGRLGYSAQRDRPPPLRQMPIMREMTDIIEMRAKRAVFIETAPL
jgi:hypothetical protein